MDNRLSNKDNRFDLLLDDIEISPQIQKVILCAFNTFTEGKALSDRIIDNPHLGKTEEQMAYGLRPSVAKRVIEFRGTLPEKQFQSLSEILAVKGIGKDTFADIVYSFRIMPAVTKALFVLNAERDAKTLAKLVLDRKNLNSETAGLIQELASNIIELRDTLPGKVFTDLNQLMAAPGITKETVQDIFFTFSQEVLKGDQPFVNDETFVRANLAVALAPFLSMAPENEATRILGSDPIIDAIEFLSGGLDPEYIEFLNSKLTLAIALDIVTLETRVGELVYLPQKTEVTTAIPDSVRDPASIPGAPVEYSWFTMEGPTLLQSPGPLNIRLLIEGKWSPFFTYDDPISVEPVTGGVRIRKFFGGPLGVLGNASNLTEEDTEFLIPPYGAGKRTQKRQCKTDLVLPE